MVANAVLECSFGWNDDCISRESYSIANIAKVCSVSAEDVGCMRSRRGLRVKLPDCGIGLSGLEIILLLRKCFHRFQCSGSVEELEQGFEQWKVVFMDISHWIKGLEADY